ncbi:MAG TPA: hypothetical protein VHX61_10280 [Rhizomicrobium sp.]|nr:hypothetical protein [Rhizomicrobium sp.]
MRIQLIGLVSALAILAPLAGVAAEPGNTAGTAQPVAVEQQTNPVVCHYFYYQGTVINQQICRTKHEWERRRFAEQRFIREFQLHALSQN